MGHIAGGVHLELIAAVVEFRAGVDVGILVQLFPFAFDVVAYQAAGISGCLADGGPFYRDIPTYHLIDIGLRTLQFNGRVLCLIRRAGDSGQKKQPCESE